MALDTNLSLRQSVIYQVYNRNHNHTGTFRELIYDLKRIKELGVDIVYLLPIHPIGKKDKKGSLGCPYSIQDYREVNPEYGTLEDFKDLIKATHEHGMKLMIDVVYNHTSRDSVLLKTHPEWFYKNDEGEFANRIGDWSDVTDLDYTKDVALWDELIDILKYWAALGVDGYRCDVASFIPIKFWIKARSEVAKINPDFIWLAESVDGGFIKGVRSLGYEVCSDSELYQAFDICYDYDVYCYFKDYLLGKSSLAEYVKRVQLQEYIYPGNYVKLRCLENHDQARIASLVQSKEQLNMWTAFNYLQKGATMIYAGQEASCQHQPSLFDVDKVDWSHYNEAGMADLMKQLAIIKKDPVMSEGYYEIELGTVGDTVYLSYESSVKQRLAIFNFSLKAGDLFMDVADGTYKNLLTQQDVIVKNKTVTLSNEPIIFDINK
ncbi:alpha-amylase family glycosyl hydrolase [Turicibacter sp. TJ11]|uniref:alpha-amylase family glycosyl hydrolase n=1 Tax=Turicibacter sp. TJ11 TaxID=2806443 RepID=UPI001F39EFBB|nr:alpha-amylase family glycosyl hydrolase [Turicibacter sp. TJ11]